MAKSQNLVGLNTTSLYLELQTLNNSYNLNHVQHLIIFFFLGLNTYAKEDPHPCFNFETKSLTLLKPAPTKFEEGKDLSEKGTNEKKIDWAQVGGVVNKPIKDLYLKLTDPTTIRNGDNVKVKVKELESKNFLKYIEQTIDLRPRFFLSLVWKEHWAFALKEGTSETPKTMVISYQKFEGTSHIDHFCGNIMLQSIAANKTEVYIYQEMKATRRDSQNILDDISGTLRTLRQ